MDKDTLKRMFGPKDEPQPAAPDRAALLLDQLEAMLDRQKLPKAEPDRITAALAHGTTPPDGYTSVGAFPLVVDVYRGPAGDYVVVLPLSLDLEVLDQGTEEPTLINPSVEEDADRLLAVGMHHIPEEGQSQDAFVAEELSKDEPPMPIEQWAITAAKLITDGAFKLDRIADWSVRSRVEDLIAKLAEERSAPKADSKTGV